MLPDLFRRLKPVHGDRIDRLWLWYQLGTPEERRDIEALLTVRAVKEQGIAVGNERIVLSPPPANVIGGGEFVLGRVEYPGLPRYDFTLRRTDLLRHLFLLGPSGTGKSTLIIGLLQQLLRGALPFWCIDFKRNYRCLLHDKHGGRLVVFSVGRNTSPLMLNMLSPPQGVERNEWAEALTDVISTSYLLMHGARNTLKSSLLGAITTKGNHATLRDALGIVTGELARARAGSRKYGWLESTHRSLDELTKGTLGHALNATNPLPLNDLLQIPVVFELQGLGDDQKKCVCLYLLQTVLLLRKHQTDQREILRHVLVFDEAHNVFPKDQWGTISLPSRLAREVREYGEAIISATQQTDVADSLIANSATKIILRTDYPKDVEFASKLLQIETQWLPKIPLGQGIARLAERYYQPFLFSFPEQPIKNQPIPDEHITDRYAQWSSNLINERTSHNDDLRDALNDFNQHAAKVLGAIKNQDADQPEPSLLGAITNARKHAVREEQSDPQLGAMAPVSSRADERARLLVADIARHPISTVTERYERLGWNPKIGNATKDTIIKNGLATFEVLPVGNGRVKLLSLTDAGAQIAREHGDTAVSSGRASMEHEFWRSRLAERLTNRGYKITREYDIGRGKRVDLRAVRGNEELLVEIETGKSNINENITKCQGHKGTLVLFSTQPLTDERRAALTARDPRIIVIDPATLDAFTASLTNGFPRSAPRQR